MRGHGAGGEEGRARHRRSDPFGEKHPAEDARLDAKVVAPEAGLDGDLPETGGAEEQLVLGIVQLPFGARRQPFRLTRRPKEELRVEQQLHAPIPNSVAISRSPMRSKSSG